MSDDVTPETTAAATADFHYDAVPAVARALGLAPAAVGAVVAMLDEGNTVPFIARYRKERTGGLDEVQIRAIEEQRTYLVELETRRAAILASVAEQGKLTPELEAKLRAATGKAELEDLYAPYRPRRKTRASVARDKGLEPLAQKILAQGAEGNPAAEAAGFVTEQVATAQDALAGARDIAAEIIADTAAIRTFVRHEYAEHGELSSEVVPGKKGDEVTKFEQYYQFKEAVKTIPSHRFLAIRRGEAEGVLRAHVAVDTARVEAGILRLAKLDEASPWAGLLRQAAADALKRLLAPSVENDVRAELKLRSDNAAVDIFAGNLRNLMLAAPLGSAAVIGVDPGLRTGCKCAAIDATGKFLGTVTVYISQGEAQLAKAKEEFVAFVTKFKPHAIAVGNGTGGREAEAFVKRALAEAGLQARTTAGDDAAGGEAAHGDAAGGGANGAAVGPAARGATHGVAAGSEATSGGPQAAASGGEPSAAASSDSAGGGAATGSDSAGGGAATGSDSAGGEPSAAASSDSAGGGAAASGDAVVGAPHSAAGGDAAAASVTASDAGAASVTGSDAAAASATGGESAPGAAAGGESASGAAAGGESAPATATGGESAHATATGGEAVHATGTGGATIAAGGESAPSAADGNAAAGAAVDQAACGKSGRRGRGAGKAIAVGEPHPARTGPFVVQVNEAGASVYSASDLAREEFPELDLTIRGAISIARRLQDPLAELVKIEPKSIGVGQYQHDVHQPMLAKKLGDVVEDCVNHVGVELNTASAQLLSYVAGVGKSLAKKIVVYRDAHGAFKTRAQLLEVSSLGPKAFEQAAGFLRIANAAYPLDQSAVHPERYPLVEKIAKDLGVELPALLGNQELVDKIDFAKYVTEEVGEPTLRDIAAELVKPGRDPRAEFSPPKFRDDVTAMEDLKVGMVLEGIVTNVTAFGAFVDIGVHNDGLVHVSQLSDQFVKDPSEVVKVGQKLTVRVIEVDNQRKRIALSAKKGGQQQQRQPRRDDGGQPEGGQRPPRNRGRGGGGGGGGGGQRAPYGHGQSHQGPGYQGQGHQGQGHQGQGHQGQGHQGQGHQGQGHQGQGGQGHPGQGGQGQRGQGRRGQGGPGYQGQGGPGYQGQGGPGHQGQGAPGHQGPGGQGYQGPSGQGYQGPSGQGYQGQGHQGQGHQGQGHQGQGHQGQGHQGQGQQGQGYQGPGGQGYQGPGGQGYQGPGGQGYQGPGGQGHQGQDPQAHGGPGYQGQDRPGEGGQGRPQRDDRRGPPQGGRETRQWADRPHSDRGPQPEGSQGAPQHADQAPGGGANDRGPNDRGPNDRGPYNGPRGNDGPRGNGGPRRDDRGPQGDRGPRRDGPPGDRGPQGGYQGDRGPRRDGPPGDRGPQGGFQGDRGPRRDGPPGDRGPQGGYQGDRGPRRDDRGPQGGGGPQGDRGPQGGGGQGGSQSNWGVSGFTNNPFAKLQGKGGNKGRS